MQIYRILAFLFFANYAVALPSLQERCQAELFQQRYSNLIIVEAMWESGAEEKYQFCKLTARTEQRLSRVDQQSYAIGFELRLPSHWNQRFLFQGNGGTDGRILPATGGSANHAISALDRGFAVISSDAGHTSSSLFGGALFGRDPEARLNYGYRVNQILTPVAKKIITDFYQAPIQYAYFMGCSNGGRHAMVAASRLAREFDGFIAGNPGFNLPKAAVQHAWDVQTLSALNTDLTQSLSQTDLNVLSQGILKACDTLDGVKDDMVQAISQCQQYFQIITLACDDSQAENCLSANKIAAIERLFNGPVNSRGETLYSDWPYDVGVNGADWRRWKITSPIANLPMIATLGAGSLAEIFVTPPASIEPSPQGFVNFLREFDFDKDAAKIFATTDTYVQSAMEFMTPPLAEQLSDLSKEGGKLLVYHGASDGVFSVNDTINWYQKLNQNHDDKAGDFARLFVVPGMNHCAGGPSTDRFDVLSSLVDWVENNRQPAFIVASVNPNNPELPDAWSKTRKRPLCPYPQVAYYNGKGDIEQADSFACR